MGNFGGTTGTIVGGGSVIIGTVATPLPYTLLSLNRYARIMQINPAHFNGLASPTIFPLTNRCSDVWMRYDWQSPDSVSLESLALSIQGAENDIKKYMHYSVGPDWQVKDIRPWPTYHRRDALRFPYPYAGFLSMGYGASYMTTPIQTSYNYVISPGQRAVSLIAADVNVAYSDPDGDGYNELATITANTSLTDVKEIKVYQASMYGAREWEIRPVKAKAIAAGVVTITFPSWALVNPDKREIPPSSDGEEALDLFDVNNYLATVDVYREYTDTTAVSAEVFWPNGCALCGGAGCSVCTQLSQTGCAKVISVNPGFMHVQPATFSDGAWNTEVWVNGLEPTQVLLWYSAGFQSNRYLADEAYDPIDDGLAQAIAWLATARLERPFCNCGTATSLAVKLMTDMAISEGDVGKTTSEEDLNNPFGTRLGEIWAYRRLKKIGGKPLGGYVI